MTIIRLVAWSVAVTSTAWVWFAARPNIDDPYVGLVVTRDEAYRVVDGLPLRLDLLRPTEQDRGLPLLVAVHGGSWMGGTKREYGPQFANLVRNGIAVAIVDYRLARPGAPSWDGALDDLRKVLDHLLQKADEHGLDPRRIATLGTSSGGLLAALAAQTDDRIAAAVCLSTPTSLADLAAERGLPHEPAGVFLGRPPQLVPKLSAAASPFERASSGGPAMLLIHGDDDAWVPIEEARRLHNKLELLRVPTRLIEVPGARHGFDLQLGSPSPRDLTPDIREFLESAWTHRTSNRHDR